MEGKPSVICFLGMHRAGTSMVAHLLSQCGVYLGGMGELLPANADDNPAGYWENQRFVEINDDLLEQFGGSWMEPPTFPKGWANAPEIEPIRVRARALIAEFNGHAVWGWKDPRTCLTLEFWQQLIPEMSYVVCVREPSSVARSLAVRRYATVGHEQAYRLWKRYYDSVLPLIEGEPTVMCRYATFSYDAKSELERITSELGLPVSDAALAEAATAVQSKLWRNIPTGPSPDVPAEVSRLFAELIGHCGPIAAKMAQDASFANMMQSLHQERAAEQVTRLESLYVERSQENTRLRSLLVRLSEEIGQEKSKHRGKTVDELLKEGAQSHKEGDLGFAADLYHCANLVAPEDPRPLHQLGIVCSIQGRPREAAEVLRQCVVLAPKEPMYRHHYAFALMECGLPDRALEQLELLSAGYPRAFPVHFDRANLLLKMSRFSDAIKVYQICLVLDPTSADAMLNLGLAFEGVGQHADAIQQYQRALRVRPNWELALSNLSQCQQQVA